MKKDLSKENTTKIFDFSKFKKKKDIEIRLSGGRRPLYVSHLNGKISGDPKAPNDSQSDDNFADRVERIRASLERIAVLMSELKKLSNLKKPQ